MEVDFENTLIRVFEKLEISRFKVNFAKHNIFVCGGLVDGAAKTPPSFRDRFLLHSDKHEEEIRKAIVLAESFKDYFKDNTFNDLLIFEDEIANLSSLILIFLESPGSMVELGMFCSRPEFYKKLLIVAPQKETEGEDSFIYLGPLDHIKRKDDSSVVVYPWPDERKEKYQDEYLDDLLEHVKEKLEAVKKEVNFSQQNSGHMALLIYEIIRLSYPVLIGEIELSLTALDLDISEVSIKRHLYLLTKLGMIRRNHYSSYTYYYPILKELKTMKFGKDKDGKIPDSQSIQMEINQSYIMTNTPQARKRRAAKQQINSKQGEATNVDS